MGTDSPPDMIATLELGLDRLPPIFAHCLGRHQRLSRAFQIDGFVYATNGKLAVRTPTPPGWGIPNPDHLVDRVAEAFVGDFEPTAIAIPDLGDNFGQDCPKCQGRRFLPERHCEACRGLGEYYVLDDCECPHCTGHHSCTECEGKGRHPVEPCFFCNRTGFAGDEEAIIEIRPTLYLSCRTLALFTRFGVDVYLPRVITPGGHHIVRFTLDGVEGRLADSRPPHSDTSC